MIGPSGALFACTSLMNFVIAAQAVDWVLLSALLRSRIRVDLTSRVLVEVPSSGALLTWVLSAAICWAALSTVTVKRLVAVFPAWSVAVQLTAVEPIGKVEPGAGVQITGTVTSTMSVAVGSG